MTNTSLLIYVTHGTYGRDDDGFGALMAANSALAKGIDTTIVLMDDGVAMAKSGQDTSRIGLPNNLDDLQDFLELDGRLIAVKECLEERGISLDELVENVEIIEFRDIGQIIEDHNVSITL